MLEDLFAAGVAACDPRAATRDAVLGLDFDEAPAVVAVGKAARGMAVGALDALATHGLVPRAGLVVSHASTPDGVGPLPHVTGSHPVPDEHSFRAARRLGEVAAEAREGREVLVLLSGGTTSLIARPVEGIPGEDLRAVFEALLGSGAPITAMNTVRRRVLQWGGGRLAAALHPARVRCLIVSDVMGGELAAIGSGPCVADPSTARDVRGVLARWKVPLTAAVDAYLARVEQGAADETPKPGDRRLAGVETRVLLENAAAVRAVEAAADRLGLTRLDDRGLLAGEAASVGRGLGATLHGAAVAAGPARRVVLVRGGETTVTLPAGRVPPGGRCQELALACAQVIGRAPDAAPVSLLAAGTDGRDGPTDAAGAVVDRSTWRRIAAAGRDPGRDLERHDVHAALDAVGALLRTGATGTNVNDLVIAIVG